jgi:hypothetical protein
VHARIISPKGVGSVEMLGGVALGFVMIGRSQGSNFNGFSLVNTGILAPLGFCTHPGKQSKTRSTMKP